MVLAGNYANIDQGDDQKKVCDVGSRLIDQGQKMTVAASAIAEKKTVGHRS